MIDRFRGVIYGLACGDALGWPVEFSRVREIRERFGPAGITELSQTRGQYTDDTQMTIALAQGLLDASIEATSDPSGLLGDADHVAPYIAKRFVAWSVSPENNRAPGTSCMSGCRRLAEGVPWREGGLPSSSGCGSIMRVAPVGLVYRDPQTISEIARASAQLTHGHKLAIQAAHLGAMAVRATLDRVAPNMLVKRLIIEGRVEGLDESLEALLRRVPLAVKATLDGAFEPHEVQVSREKTAVALGEAWKADEALACALYCFLLADARGEGYVETVRYGANTDGDSDSIASIAGGLAGARWGIDGRGVPSSWIERIENVELLGELARNLHDLSQSLA